MHSFFEANTNTWLGLAVSWVLMQSALLLNGHIGVFWATNVGVLLCTIWSLARNYYVRRHFNKHQEREVRELLQALRSCREAILDANRNGYTRGHPLLAQVNTILQRYKQEPVPSEPIRHVQV